MDEEIEVGDTVTFDGGKVHWSVKKIVPWFEMPGGARVHLESQMSGHRRVAYMRQLELHSKGTADA